MAGTRKIEAGGTRPHGRPATVAPGARFGRLVVADRAENGPRRQVRWRCMCDCGGETVARADDLRSGHVTSCGCARAERARRRLAGDAAGDCWQAQARAAAVVEMARMMRSPSRYVRHGAGARSALAMMAGLSDGDPAPVLSDAQRAALEAWARGRVPTGAQALAVATAAMLAAMGGPQEG